MLQRTEFGFKKLLNLETGLFNVREKYFDAIRQSLGSSFSVDYDNTAWLEFTTSVLEIGSNLLVANMTDWHRMMERMYEFGAEADLLPRQVDGFMFASWTGQISRGQYLEITSVSPVTASRDLADLVQKGILTTEGKTRSRIYRPVPQADLNREVVQAG